MNLFSYSQSKKISSQNPEIKKDINFSSDNFASDNKSISKDTDRRGINVYSISQLVNTYGKAKDGKFLSSYMEYPYFRLSTNQRVEFMKMCAPLHGLISSRMQKISTTKYKVIPKKNIEDRLYDEMKNVYNIYKEYENAEDLKYIYIKEKLKQVLIKELPDLLPDLSNFDKSILRWSKRIQNKHTEKAEEIENWLQEPNLGVDFIDFLKKIIFDLHIHGSCAMYKQFQSGKLANFDVLPGGTVYKVRDRYFGNVEAYVQIAPGFNNQFFFSDEIAYLEYLPVSSQSFPIISVEALLNKVVSYLLHDLEMANQSDGTRPPEKMLAVAKKETIGDFDRPENIKINPSEQKRLETKINEPRKYPIIVHDNLTGDVMQVIDLSKENIMTILDSRQDKIKQDIALVYNAMPFEMGLTGSDFTSGRETSTSQMELSHGKGMAPILKIIGDMISKDIIPYRFGYDYILEFEKEKNELQEKQLELLKLQTGELTKNELREEKGKNVFEGDQYNLPEGAQPTQQAGENEFSPLFTKQIK